MGWLALAVLAAAAFAALALLGIARALWSLAGAALMLGATGYALQQHATLPGSPAVAAAADPSADEALIALRDTMMDRYTSDHAYLVAADAMGRIGERHAAAEVILGGVRAQPRSTMLWTALGTTLAAHDGDQVSPAALFAFQQAARLSPRHPAPPFFLGLARVQAGDFAAARPLWARALALTPAQAPYRAGIAERLVLLDRLLAVGPRR